MLGAWGEWGMTANKYRVSSGNEESAVKLDKDDGCTAF